METIRNFDQMARLLSGQGRRRRVAVVCPYDDSTQTAVENGLNQGLIQAILVGNSAQIGDRFSRHADHTAYIEAQTADEACQQAVELVRRGEADVLMKGLVNTDNLLRAVLSKSDGILPQGNVLTHLTCAQIPGYERLLSFTDVAVIPHPTPEQRRQQLRYVLGLCRMLGIEEPRVGLINCTEKVNERHFPFTLDYRELRAEAERGDYGPCIVDGPLDLKTCLSPEALRKKGLSSPLEGRADAVIFPDIQAGNVFYKTITLFAHARTAAMLAGASAPIVLPSRGDSDESKFYSLCLACLC